MWAEIKNNYDYMNIVSFLFKFEVTCLIISNFAVYWGFQLYNREKHTACHDYPILDWDTGEQSYFGPKVPLVWKPSSCPLLEYTKEKNPHLCFENLKIDEFIFFGDEDTYNLYSSFINLITEKEENLSILEERKEDVLTKGDELSWKEETLGMEILFYLSGDVGASKDSNNIWDTLEDVKLNDKETHVVIPSYILFQNESTLTSQQNEYIRKLKAASKTKSVTIIILNDGRSIPTLKMFTLRDEFRYSNVLFAEEKLQVPIPDNKGSPVLQTLLNLYCNDKIHIEGDTACCSADPELFMEYNSKRLHNMFFSAAVIVQFNLLIYMAVLMYKKRISSQVVEDQKQVANTTGISTSLLQYSFIIIYFILSDRIELFPTHSKIFGFEFFYIPMVLTVVVSFFWRKKCKEHSYLNRDITDELKGWMQVVIIFYHVSGAKAHSLFIYGHVRVLVSMYIFLTGFGHYVYYWSGKPMGFFRYVQVMFRMNFLPLSLCLFLRRPYENYYFMPLISFWYTLGYVILSVPPHPSKESSRSKYVVAVLKLVMLVVASLVIYNMEIPLANLMSTSYETPHSQFLISFWWKRYDLDRFSLFYGMFFGLVFCAVKDNSTGNRDHNSIHGPETRTKGMTLIILVIVGLFLLYEVMFAYLVPDGKSYDEIHPYIALIPIIFYIIVRNISESFRSTVSTLMAYFGKISLELFICQYHIFLSRNCRLVHSLVPSSPLVNFMVILFTFMVIAKQFSVLTGVAAKHLVPSSEEIYSYKSINFISFLVVVCCGISFF